MAESRFHGVLTASVLLAVLATSNAPEPGNVSLGNGAAVRLASVAFRLSWASPPAREPCGGADTHPWVTEAAERARSQDGLFRFTSTELGQPIACDGTVTGEFDGASFGTVVFGFPEGVTLSFETMPPAVSIVTLSRPDGFEDPAGVQAAVRRYAGGSGLSIKWEDPERSADGDVLIERFWDPDPGLNASVSLTWLSGALVSLRVSRAP
jgi:hypothetical protein